MNDWCDCGHPTISAHKRRDCPHTPFSKDSGGCNLGDPAIVPAPAGQPPDASAAQGQECRWTAFDGDIPVSHAEAKFLAIRLAEQKGCNVTKVVKRLRAYPFTHLETRAWPRV